MRLSSAKLVGESSHVAVAVVTARPAGSKAARREMFPPGMQGHLFPTRQGRYPSNIGPNALPSFFAQRLAVTSCLGGNLIVGKQAEKHLSCAGRSSAAEKNPAERLVD